MTVLEDPVLVKIKHRGYWRVNFRPTVYRQRIPRVAECRKFVEGNAVSLRGWEYPAVLRGAPNVVRPNTDKYAGLTNDWQNHIEHWRMYKSGQFLHLLALREDWMTTEQVASLGDPEVTPGKMLSVVGTIYQATEIYQFLANLVRAGIYDDGVELLIELHNVGSHQLWLADPLRVGFSYPRITDAERLSWRRTHSKTEILDGFIRFARELLVDWFDAFDWQAPDDLIVRDQEKLLTRRL